MLRNLFTIAYRNLFKNRAATLINIIGLSIGAAGSLVVFTMLNHELNFDEFQKGKNSTYLAVSTTTPKGGGTETKSFITPYPLGSYFSSLNPEVPICRIHGPQQMFLAYEQENGQREKQLTPDLLFVDTAFFHFMDYGMGEALFLLGDPEHALKGGNKIILSEKWAHHFFGSPAAAMGKVLTLNNYHLVTVAGVVQNPPKNTSFYFSALLSFDVILQTFPGIENRWVGTWDCKTLFKAHSEQELEKVLTSMQQVVDDKVNGHPEAFQTSTVAAMPLTDIHTSYEYQTPPNYNVPNEIFWALLLLGIFCIVTATANFVNLSTAQAANRAREVGIRKVMGSGKKMLWAQFLSETAVVVFISLFVALAVTEAALSEVNVILSSIAYDLHLNSQVLLFTLLLGIIVTLLAGSYPAFVMSGYTPVSALKGKLLKRSTHKSRMSWGLRKSLIVFQFTVVQFAIICTLVATAQMWFIQEKDLGFHQESILTVDVSEVKRKQNLAAFRAELLRKPAVEQVAFGMTTPIDNGGWSSQFRLWGSPKEDYRYSSLKQVDEHYLSLYEIPLLAGRNLNPQDAPQTEGETRTYKLLLNREGVKNLGLPNPEAALGRKIHFNGSWKGEVVGVVEDFHAFSVKDEIPSIILIYDAEHFNLASIRLTAGHMRRGAEAVAASFKKIFPEEFYHYSFLDDIIQEIYLVERFLFQLVSVFAVVNILIAIMGLYGLISYLALNKTKEIGVRKVLGASRLSILKMFSKQFAQIILIAFIPAAFFAWLGMDAWLKDFAFKINLNPAYFFVGLLISSALALGTVGYRSWKAASANPVQSLKQE